MLSQWLITTGLSCDVVGAVLVLTFALGPKVSRGGASFLQLEGADPEESTKAERYERFGKVGAVLIILGFVLQISGVWV